MVDVETGKITVSERVQTDSVANLGDKSEEIARILASRMKGLRGISSIKKGKEIATYLQDKSKQVVEQEIPRKEKLTFVDVLFSLSWLIIVVWATTLAS